MKRIFALICFLVVGSIAQAQNLAPLQKASITWLNSSGTTVTTISGTDSVFSSPIDVAGYDSAHFTIALPASDSARFFVIYETGYAGVYTGATTVDSIVSVGTASVKNIRIVLPVASQVLRIKLRAYNTAGVPTANGITTAGKPTLTNSYNSYFIRRRQ